MTGWRRLILSATAVLASASISACTDAETSAGTDDGPVTTEERLTTSTTTAGDRSPRNQGVLTRDAWGTVDAWTWMGQQRHLEGTRRVTVPVRFLTDDPVTVTSIALRTPHFESLPPEAKDSLLQPRRKVALQVDLGPARCAELGDGEPEVHLTVRGADGVPADLVLPVPTWLLDQLRERECTVAALTEAVSVGFGDFGEPDGIALETELVVERLGTTEPIEIERMAGSVLLTLEQDAGEAGGSLAAGETTVRIPVEVTASRCDAHGLAGSQKTFVFSVWVAVGDAPAVYLEVVPDADLQAAMGATIDACIRGDD